MSSPGRRTAWEAAGSLTDGGGTLTSTGGGSGVVEPTGDQAVDEALSRLTDVTELGLREQLAVFDAVHTALRDRLADAEG